MRKSYMLPSELKEAIVAIYGAKGGGRKLAEDIGISHITISRQLNGISPISKVEAELIRTMFRDVRKVDEIGGLL